MPFSVGSAIVSVLSGFVLAKVRRDLLFSICADFGTRFVQLQRYRAIISVSFALCTLGFALMASLDEKSNRYACWRRDRTTS